VEQAVLAFGQCLDPHARGIEVANFVALGALAPRSHDLEVASAEHSEPFPEHLMLQHP